MNKNKILKILNIYFVLIDIYIVLFLFLPMISFFVNTTIESVILNLWFVITSADGLILATFSQIVFVFELVFCRNMFTEVYRKVIVATAMVGTVLLLLTWAVLLLSSHF